MILDDLGLRSFTEAYSIQSELVLRVAHGQQDETLQFVEHPHVFTIGRGGRMENLLACVDPDGCPIELIRINRGGDITYHGPGQLVGYPHLDLRRRGRDVGLFIRGLEQSLIRTAIHFGVKAFRRQDMTGIWTRHGKLGFIGVGVRHWVTMHGFALNVDPDMRYFRLIHPCGLIDCPVTSLAAESEKMVTLDEVKDVCWHSFCEVFGRVP